MGLYGAPVTAVTKGKTKKRENICRSDGLRSDLMRAIPRRENSCLNKNDHFLATPQTERKRKRKRKRKRERERERESVCASESESL